MPIKAKVQDSRLSGILQQAANTELTVSQHYLSRAVFWRNVGLTRLAEAYEKEADEERGHFRLVADRMAFLGTMPELRPDAENPATGSLKTQTLQDLNGEVLVADQYAIWVRACLDLGDFTTMDIMKRILLETEEHADHLQGQLAQIEQMGEEVYLGTWK